jgi:hypothetical protein
MTSPTLAERAIDLFQQRPPGENRIDWLANQLLALVAAEPGPLELRIAPTAGMAIGTFAYQPPDDVGRSAEPRKAPPHVSTSHTLVCVDYFHEARASSADPGPLRLFRTLLARVAKMAEEESGTAFNPYGGKLHFDRPGPNGPVRLDVHFVNTTESQFLGMVRAALPQPAAPGVG